MEILQFKPLVFSLPVSEYVRVCLCACVDVCTWRFGGLGGGRERGEREGEGREGGTEEGRKQGEREEGRED